jgi:TolB-like protein/class 3 adenylate cyclase
MQFGQRPYSFEKLPSLHHDLELLRAKPPLGRIMGDREVKRRLAAILAADVAGYTRLVEQDTDGTVEAWKAARDDVIKPLVAEKSGQIIKFTGDGFLVEFSSVQDAVTCAIAMQGKLASSHLKFRMGINVGDITDDGSDVHGEGVNIAARIEALAEPAGISISGDVYSQVRNRIDFAVHDLGEQTVKHIARPIRVYQIILGDDAGANTRGTAAWRFQSSRTKAVAAAFASLILVGGALSWQFWNQRAEHTSIGEMAFQLPKKPSIAVLSFANMSGDQAHTYFGDGIAEDIITDLSKIASLFVISRNSAFFYKGKVVKISKIAEELGVRYVLEGSVRLMGDQVRINAQLIDATTGGHLWADRYDGVLANVFELQDKVTANIVSALALNLTNSERDQLRGFDTTNIAARDAFQKGWELYRQTTPEKNAIAVKYFKQALELDPNYERAHAASSMAYIKGCGWGWAEELGISGGSSEKMAQYHLSKTDINTVPLSNVAASQFSLYMNRQHEGQISAARAVALDPNEAEGHLAMAWALITAGRPEDGILSVQRAIRLDPRHANYYASALGMAYFAMDELERAADVLTRAWRENKSSQQLIAPLAATYAHLGMRREAREVLGKYATDKMAQSDLISNSLPYKWSAADHRVVKRMYDGVDLGALPQEITLDTLIENLIAETDSNHQETVKKIGWFGRQAKAAVPALI